MPSRRKNETRKEYNARMKMFMRERYRKRKTEALTYLGGKCSTCGTTEDLEFDHKQQETKNKNVTLMTGVSEARFWAEVEKCQLLCKDCHIKKSLKETGKQSVKGVHGTYGNYRHHGCRCNKCKAANAEATRKYREKYGR